MTMQIPSVFSLVLISASLTACGAKSTSSALNDSSFVTQDISLPPNAAQDLFTDLKAQADEAPTAVRCVSFGAITSSGTSCAVKELLCSVQTGQGWARRLDGSVKVLGNSARVCAHLKSRNLIVEGDANGAGAYHILRGVSAGLTTQYNGGQVVSQVWDAGGQGKVASNSGGGGQGGAELNFSAAKAQILFEHMNSLGNQKPSAVSCLSVGAVTSWGTSCSAEALYCNQSSTGGFVLGRDGSWNQFGSGPMNQVCEELRIVGLPISVTSGGISYRVLKSLSAERTGSAPYPGGPETTVYSASGLSQ